MFSKQLKPWSLYKSIFCIQNSLVRRSRSHKSTYSNHPAPSQLPMITSSSGLSYINNLLWILICSYFQDATSHVFIVPNTRKTFVHMILMFFLKKLFNKNSYIKNLKKRKWSLFNLLIIWHHLNWAAELE